MGYANHDAAMNAALERPVGHPARIVYGAAAAAADDDDVTPRYFGGWPRLARALGHNVPDTTVSPTTGKRRTPSGEEFPAAWSAYKRARAELVKAGHWVPKNEARVGEAQEFAMPLIPKHRQGTGQRTPGMDRGDRSADPSTIRRGPVSGPLNDRLRGPVSGPGGDRSATPLRSNEEENKQQLAAKHGRRNWWDGTDLTPEDRSEFLAWLVKTKNARNDGAGLAVHFAREGTLADTVTEWRRQAGSLTADQIRDKLRTLARNCDAHDHQTAHVGVWCPGCMDEHHEGKHPGGRHAERVDWQGKPLTMLTCRQCQHAELTAPQDTRKPAAKFDQWWARA